MKTLTIAALVAGLALTAGASAVASDDAAAPTAKRTCFFSSQISGWREGPDEEVVYLDVGANDVYRLDMFGRCVGLDTAITIGVETAAAGHRSATAST